MGKKGQWNIEECRSKFESDEHWKLKKDFLLAHKDKFTKQRLICLANVFVNVQLMRCRYPDPVMRQIAELSKGIGIDYKTVQKKRLQRTFVPASDAAAAKVKKIKLNLKETKSDGDTPSGDVSTPSDGVSNELPKSKKKKKRKKVLNNNKNEVSEEKVNQSQADFDSVSGDAIEEPLKNKNEKSEKLEIDVTEKSDTEIFLAKMKTFLKQTEKNNCEANDTFDKPAKRKKIEKIVFNENEVESKAVNKYAEALKSKSYTGLTSFVSPKIASISNKPKEKLDNSLPETFYEDCFDPEDWKKSCFDSEDLYKSNIFFVKRNFASIKDHYSLLHDSLAFSKLEMKKDFISCYNRKAKCILTTNVNYEELKLGEAIDDDQNSASNRAAIFAVENLLKKCFTVVIKKRANSDGIIDKLDQNHENQKEEKRCSVIDKSISSDNVGAKMLKLMGWSGGGLGKLEDGIKEPIGITKPIGRSGLGLKNENNVTPTFRRKVIGIIKDMVVKICDSVDNVVNDLVFSTELSNEQRKFIHLYIKRNYKQLRANSYGQGQERYLTVSPKVDNQKLVRCVLSQGGSTEKYEVHRPGTLKADFFFSQ